MVNLTDISVDRLNRMIHTWVSHLTSVPVFLL